MSPSDLLLHLLEYPHLAGVEHAAKSQLSSEFIFVVLCIDLCEWKLHASGSTFAKPLNRDVRDVGAQMKLFSKLKQGLVEHLLGTGMEVEQELY